MNQRYRAVKGTRDLFPPESEKFAGALRTYSIEALMGDGRALQAGTSHNLGQNFAKAFELKFQTEAGGVDFAWNTSWGVSTRLVGGLVMTHGDDKGLRTPPLLAPIEIVIVPIWKSDEDKGRVRAAAHLIKESLLAWERRVPGRLRVHVDDREGMKPGAKYYEWELRGIPVRLEIGPRDLEQNQAIMVRRDTGVKRSVALASIGEDAADLLHQIQESMLIDARERREHNSIRGGITYDRFREVMDGDGAFVYAEAGEIKKVGTRLPTGLRAARTIRAPYAVVVPGLINTHHHLFQTLTRACTAAARSSP